MTGKGSLRRFAACVLLCVMAVNFAAEGMSLLARTVDFKTLLSYMVDPAAFEDVSFLAAQGSCCEVLPEPVNDSCGCSCCGDICPMGDACQCEPDGQPDASADGLFFRLPSCHLGSPGAADMLPLSLSVEYLATVAVAPPKPQNNHVVLSDYTTRLCRFSARPVVPPPRSAAV